MELTFKNSRGVNLSAILELPDDRSVAFYAVFSHCFTCNKGLPIVRNISKALGKNGIATLRYDMTGLGDSEGKFVDTNFSTAVEDIISSATFLKENFQAPAILIGHSLGGAASLHAASKLPSIVAVATIGAPSDPFHVTKLFESRLAVINQVGFAEVQIGGRTFRIKRQFVDDIRTVPQQNAIRNLGKAVLLLHSPADTIVDIENAGHIYRSAKHPKSFISLDGADHLLINKEDAAYAGQIIADWAKRYIK